MGTGDPDHGRETEPPAVPTTGTGRREQGIRPATASTAVAVEGGVHAATASTADAQEPVADAALQEYRKHCVSAEQKSQEDYDKSVLTLSGGALGVSFAFLKDVVGPGALAQTNLLFAAWLLWGCSIISTLASFWFSQIALRTAIIQVDKNTIRRQFPGRSFSRITATLNALGGLAFVAGVVVMVLFVMANIGHIHPAANPPSAPAGPGFPGP
jgi:hypothetical protein